MAHSLKLIRRSLHKAFVRKARLNDRIEMIIEQNKSLKHENTVKENEFILGILYKERIIAKSLINELRDEEQQLILYFSDRDTSKISEEMQTRYKLWHAYPESNKHIKSLAAI